MAARTRSDGDPVAAATPPSPASVGRTRAATAALLGRLADRRRSRYVVRREVGRGGMGVVYRVWDEDLRRELAMKVSHGGSAAGEAACTLFLDEAQITAQLAHPGILPVHELGVDDEGRAYFTMPLVRGRSLEDVIRLARAGEAGWTLTRALAVLLKVCEAMAYAHAKGVVHRDLKPSNVLVGRFGETYVVDWGVARLVDSPPPGGSEPSSIVMTHRFAGRALTPTPDTVSGRVVGTPCYMPPEQARGQLDRIGPRSDVYAIGAVLYHLLTGRRPYEGAEGASERTTAEVLGLLLARAPEPVRELAPDAPDDLAAICEKAMARDHRQRYATALEVAEDLERYLDRRPVRAQPARLRRAAGLWVLRNRRLAATVAAAAALLVLAGALFVVRLEDAADRERAARLESVRRGDRMAAAALVAREPELWPAVPDRAPAMRAWLAHVDDLLGRAPTYRAEHTALGAASDGLEREELGAMVASLHELERLRPAVAARLRDAARLSERTVDGAAATAAWEACLADVGALPAYEGLALSPQLGLLPLGRNPRTGLWEFWHVASGERPEPLDPAAGSWRVAPETGIVLVLLPGGTTTIGSPPDEPSREPAEVRHEVELAPFLVARHELTQAQYERATGRVPSLYPRATSPVESISWEDAVAVARRLDLRLLHEAEWEHAARAGEDGGWPTGDWRGLEGRENVYDLDGEPVSGFVQAPWDDGWRAHAPVGSFAPNAFGLYDVLGNVSEWTASLGVPYPGAPYRNPAHEARRVFRGGSWYLPVAYARFAFRQYDHPRGLNQARGVRLGRDVRAPDPPPQPL